MHSVTDNEGKNFNFNKHYNVAMKHYISLGRDGYVCFQDSEVSYVRGVNEAMLIKEIVAETFRKFSPAYKVQPQYEERRQQRMKLLHTNEKNKSGNGYIKIAPRVEGRIL